MWCEKGIYVAFTFDHDTQNAYLHILELRNMVGKWTFFMKSWRVPSESRPSHPTHADNLSMYYCMTSVSFFFLFNFFLKKSRRHFLRPYWNFKPAGSLRVRGRELTLRHQNSEEPTAKRPLTFFVHSCPKRSWMKWTKSYLATL